MPELPEVETVRKALEPLLISSRITAADSHPSEKFSPAHECVGHVIKGVKRRGKYLLIELSEAKELVIHLGMTGSLTSVETADYRQAKHDRARWDLDDSTSLVFNDIRRFGRIRVVPAGCYEDIATLANMGPEPFSNDFTPSGLYRALSASKRRIKTQLLSQRPVAGLGNIYVDEALWLAQIKPSARSVTKAAAERLHEACIEVLQDAIDNGGTTLRDYRKPDGSTGENQHHLMCYSRAGEPCLRCGTTLKSKPIDARNTTWCPHCQPR